MREQIIINMEKPRELEKLYRENPPDFKQAFSSIYPEMKDRMLASFWYERLHYESEGIFWGAKRDFLIILLACVAAGILSKIPAIFQISEEFFYPRNLGFIIFPFIIGYFTWKNKLSRVKTILIGLVSLTALVYINVLPDNPQSDTLVLACIHMPLLLWGLFGFSFAAGKWTKNVSKYLDFLRFNGEVAVMAALFILGGLLMTGITIGLFELIGLNIEKFYIEYVVAIALPAVPIISVYLTRTNPQLVNKVSPVIAKIFSPMILLMLLVYLGAIISSGKDPYHDRDFLILFNLLLIGVMALIFFSFSTRDSSVSGTGILLLLSVVTIVVNGIALSAILFRITEWGFTPNRLAVLGGNILILVHLILVSFGLFKCLWQKSSKSRVERLVIYYLPFYLLWAAVVVFLFPILYGFK